MHETISGSTFCLMNRIKKVAASISGECIDVSWWRWICFLLLGKSTLSKTIAAAFSSEWYLQVNDDESKKAAGLHQRLWIQIILYTIERRSYRFLQLDSLPQLRSSRQRSRMLRCTSGEDSGSLSSKRAPKHRDL